MNLEDSPTPPPPPSSEGAEDHNISTNQASSTMKGKKQTPQKAFEHIVEFYLADNRTTQRGRTAELEVRFGTHPKSGKPLSKIDYDNVFQQFHRAGFKTENTDGISMLRISGEELNRRTGQIFISKLRTEIVGLDLIQEYCRTNNIQKLLDLPSTMSAVADKIKFTKKQSPMIDEHPLKPVDFDDFNFRVAYQYEQDYYAHSNVGKSVISTWLDTKKVFRYINRVRLRHPDYPVFLDLSILKSSSKKNKYVPIPQYTVQEANVFNNEESYEVELELDNTRIGAGTQYTSNEQIMTVLRKCIRMVLSGIQGTNFPISNSEKKNVMMSYFHMVFGGEDDFIHQYYSDDERVSGKARKKLTKHFIGPSSYTLQMSNIAELGEEKESDLAIPNIRKNYTVTDKADGERKMLYIAPNGHMYMIDTNMNILFTGVVTRNKELFDSLLDGEHIQYDKKQRFVNLYAAFDIYYIKGKSVRELDFVAMNESSVPEKFRLPLLNNFVRMLEPISVLDKDSGNSDPSDKHHANAKNKKTNLCWVQIKCKTFYSSENDNIFNGCKSILTKVHDGSYEYNTDGLIFTPSSTGVGGKKSGHAGPLQKYTWEHSFKWKPAEFNTIDFLVSVKKDKNGKDEIHHVFQEGSGMNTTEKITQYKTLELRCGYSRSVHGYLNPMLHVINDELPTRDQKDDSTHYKPVPFQPTNPSDPNACYCNVALKDSGSGLSMMTQENEYFEEDMIVEFRYDVSKKGFWRWIPLRVRYDKTNDLRSGGTNYGNAYHVANSNWYSIHHPITENMITSGRNIGDIDEDVYYNKTSRETSTRALRNFHNVYVKKKLIMGASDRGNTLIDYAVGKGGDFSKWIDAKLDFVFGIDVSKDNIENQVDGACARYLNFRQKYNKMPRALFVHGTSNANIRNGKALFSEKDKQIADAVFGNGPKDKEKLGDGVYRQYGVGKEGFDISSCQFALHYFFESEKTLHSFLRNVSECTKVNGYFIGTCYDGEKVFQILNKKSKGESMAIYSGDEKIYEITKQYSHTGFPEDEYSLGYAIDVYQESINKVFREYLVHFQYLQRMLENYGFTLLTTEEAKAMQLPSGSGLFDELFHTMKDEIESSLRKPEYGNALQMTLEEKKISFMNRYFVFRKTHHVNAEKVAKMMLSRQTDTEDSLEVDDTVEEKPRSAVVIRKAPGNVKLKIGTSGQEPKKVVIRRPKA